MRKQFFCFAFFLRSSGAKEFFATTLLLAWNIQIFWCKLCMFSSKSCKKQKEN